MDRFQSEEVGGRYLEWIRWPAGLLCALGVLIIHLTTDLAEDPFLYYIPKPLPEFDLMIEREIENIYTEHPEFESPWVILELCDRKHEFNKKRVARG